MSDSLNGQTTKAKVGVSDFRLYNEAAVLMHNAEKEYNRYCHDIINPKYDISSGARINPAGEIVGTDKRLDQEDLEAITVKARENMATTFHYKVVEKHIQRTYDMEPNDRLDKDGYVLRAGVVRNRIKEIINSLPKTKEEAEGFVAVARRQAEMRAKITQIDG